jgi:hypothetical protein
MGDKGVGRDRALGGREIKDEVYELYKDKGSGRTAVIVISQRGGLYKDKDGERGSEVVVGRSAVLVIH